MLVIEGIEQFDGVCVTNPHIEVKYESNYATPQHIIDKCSRGNYYVFECIEVNWPLDIEEKLIGHILLSKNYYILGIDLDGDGSPLPPNNISTGYLLQYIAEGKTNPILIKSTLIRRHSLLTSESFGEYLKDWLPNQI